MGTPTLLKEGVGSMMSGAAWQRPPPLPKDPSYVPPARDPNRPGPRIVAEVVTLEGRVKLGRVGSIQEGAARAVCDGIRTELALGSDEPAERLAHPVRMAGASCFRLAALREPVSTELAATVNATPFAFEAAAR
jgi:hypothetical protein